MKILYISVHQILEYDETTLLTNLGHQVFALGSFFGNTPPETFRPKPASGAWEAECVAQFERLGGTYRYGAPARSLVIPQTFVRLFDVVIVMHDLDVLEGHWSSLCCRPVVWRSIGIGLAELEPRAACLRAQGLRIIRYSPVEQRAPHYAGHDAIIRFGKPAAPLRHEPVNDTILTFAHAYRQRFPREFQFRQQAVAGFNAMLAGAGNEGVPGALGVVDFVQQGQLLARSAIYFYAAGICTPYTLNFIEAWLSGIPVVAIEGSRLYSEDLYRYAEVPLLLEDGTTGFLARSPLEAAELFRFLLNTPAASRRVGAAGAAAAAKLFGIEMIAPAWQHALAALA